MAESVRWLARLPAAMLRDAAVFDQSQAYIAAFFFWCRCLFRPPARRARPLLTVSNFSRDRLALRLGVASERFTVLPIGGDHLDGVEAAEAWLDEQGLHGARHLLAVAGANPAKNLPALSDALAWLQGQRGPQRRLAIVGGRSAQVFSAATTATDPPGVLQRTGG